MQFEAVEFYLERGRLYATLICIYFVASVRPSVRSSVHWCGCVRVHVYERVCVCIYVCMCANWEGIFVPSFG